MSVFPVYHNISNYGIVDNVDARRYDNKSGNPKMDLPVSPCLSLAFPGSPRLFPSSFALRMKNSI